MLNARRLRIGNLNGFVALLAASGVLTLVSPTTQAAVVSNVTDGSTLLSADFENGTPNTDIVNSSPAVGAWIVEAGAPGRQTVEDLASEGVAAYEGNQYAKLIKDYSGAPNPLILEGVFDATALGNSGAGDLIRLKLAVQVNSAGGADNTFAIQFFDAAQSASPWGDMLLEFQLDGTGAFIATDLNFAPFPKTITAGHTPDAWNTIQIDYVNGSGSFDVSVNGGLAQTITNETVPDGNITGIRFMNRNHPASSGVYIDSVPEPASMVLLTLGGGLMMLRRRN